ncbi:tyrosine protein phosphatase [bacterium]|nr:tyrosine protein phosphatase [bacterium]
MIDIHCHILPALDDGPKDIEESTTMCLAAYDDGIRTIVATPHTMNGVFVNERNTILTEVKKFKKVLLEEDIDINIIPGSDAHVNSNMLELINQGKALTVNNNGRYILLEFPHQLVPPKIPELVFELKLNGITPIFTHPERNTAIQKDLNIILRLVEQGALTQITAMSITGEFGSNAYKCAVELLRHNLAHIIASDAHSSNIRLPLLSRAVHKASEIVGEEFATAMVTKIPQAVINGEDVPGLPEPVAPQKSFFERLFNL